MSRDRGGRTTVVLFTRDLRVHDHPALAEAAAISERVVPLFVLNDSLLASNSARLNRVQFLLESLADLDASLRALGGRLVVNWSEEDRRAILAYLRALPPVPGRVPEPRPPSLDDPVADTFGLGDRAIR